MANVVIFISFLMCGGLATYTSCIVCCGAPISVFRFEYKFIEHLPNSNFGTPTSTLLIYFYLCSVQIILSSVAMPLLPPPSTRHKTTKENDDICLFLFIMT